MKTSAKLKLWSRPSEMVKLLWVDSKAKIISRVRARLPAINFLYGLFKDWILYNPTRRSGSNHTRDEWKRIVEAVQEALPLYEPVSEAISIGLAGPLRRRAISRLSGQRRAWILDSGCGPGVSSRMLLEEGFAKIVGLDPSVILLRFSKSRLGEDFYPVVGVVEHLPLRDNSFAGALTCFSLRDVEDRSSSLRELARVVEENGRLEIVDVGKPDNLLLRKIIALYISFEMPIITRFLIRGHLDGNPFRMIVPTFQNLVTNRRLAHLVERVFGSSSLHEFLFGGLVIIEGERTK